MSLLNQQSLVSILRVEKVFPDISWKYFINIFTKRINYKPLRRASFPRSKAVRRGLATWTRGSGAGAGAEEAGGVRRKHTAMQSIRATDWNGNCQAEVQSKSSLTLNSKSKLKTPNSNSRLDWRDTIIELPTPPTPPTHPTRYFKGTSRCPTTKCYTFLETSHDPQLGSLIWCKFFANFFATLFCKPTKLTFLEVLPSSVIPFWKPLMTPNLDS